jgi:hypothetical protein
MANVIKENAIVNQDFMGWIVFIHIEKQKK